MGVRIATPRSASAPRRISSSVGVWTGTAELLMLMTLSLLRRDPRAAEVRAVTAETTCVAHASGRSLTDATARHRQPVVRRAGDRRGGGDGHAGSAGEADALPAAGR